MTITIDFEAEQEARLRRYAAREGVSVRDFVGKVLDRYLTQSTAHVSESESELLQQIGLGLSEAEWSEYHALDAKRHAQTLTSDEQARLIVLSDAVEIANARRIAALAELAALRGVTVDALMGALGIAAPDDD